MAGEPRLPVAPSLFAPDARTGRRAVVIDRRALLVYSLSTLLGLIAAVVAQVLGKLIGLVTNFAFYGRISTSFVSPAGNHLGPFVMIVPVIGGLIVGLMARFGSRAIRGHGIPEAMEQVLLNESRIPRRITILKPLSAAIAIGTGGPFGAEGPIIATGGALGSLIGQLVHTTAHERKTLLSAGAAAGMAATFGTPLSALLLAVELLLFEYRPRSLVAVALATVAAASARVAWVGAEPVFPMPSLAEPGALALIAYVIVGIIAGLASVVVTRAVYAVEDAFEELPIHWMWWPALGAIAVGVVGYIAPRTLGVGYTNIEEAVGGTLAGRALAILCVWKFISWVISLGSGTSGGTLAPLLTIGAGLGASVAVVLGHHFPGVDPRLGALVGMAALFAGASRALLASVVFAFEATHQTSGILPLLGGCSIAFFVSSLFMENSIMTEKITRRGVRVPSDYEPDPLAVPVTSAATREVVMLQASQTIADAKAELMDRSRHQGFPVVAENGRLLGVVTRRDLDSRTGSTLADVMSAPAVLIHDDATLREAAVLMARHSVGRLPVISRQSPHAVVGILTRSDLLRPVDRNAELAARKRPTSQH